MNIFLIELGLGVAVLLISTHHFVKLAEKISRAWRISPLIIGTTIVAMGTSMPELTVSVISALRGDAGLALGNIIGSNIINVFMVLPVGIFIGKLKIGTTKTQRNAMMLLGLTMIFVILQSLSISPGFSGILLLALAITFSILEFRLGIWGRKHEDAGQFKNYNKQKLGPRIFLGVLLTLAGIAAGGILLVIAIEGIANMTGYSTTLLGLTLVAAATSLPELLTTIFSQEEHEDKITIGNIIGSNIYNLVFIGGIITLFPITAKMGWKDGAWLTVSTVCLALILKGFGGKQVPKKVGVGLLILFLWYLITLF